MIGDTLRRSEVAACSREPRFLAVFIVVLAATGCESTERGLPSKSTGTAHGGIVVTGLADSPVLILLSDVLATENRGALLPAGFQIENTSSTDAIVTLTRKSCTCYGVLLDDDSFEVGETVTFAPGAQRQLHLDVAPPPLAGEKSWRITLAVGRKGEATARVPLTLTCRVVDDARMLPGVLTVRRDDAPPPSTSHSTSPLACRVDHAWRGNRMAGATPQLTGLPEGCQIAWTSGAVEALGDDLWQQSWNLSITVPNDVRASTGIHSFEVAFTAKPPVTARGRLFVESYSGVTAPGIIHLGPVPVGESRRRRIVIAADDGRAFRISNTRVETLPQEKAAASMHDGAPEVDFTCDRQRTELRHIAEVSLTPHAEGPAAGRVLLTTDHPRRPELRVVVDAIGVPREEELP